MTKIHENIITNNTTIAHFKETNNDVASSITKLKPGILHVIKRNGSITHYEADKITVAITKAFLAVEGQHAAISSRIHDIVEQLQKKITQTFSRRMPQGGQLHIEDIQDQVELALMRAGLQKIARAYVLYREKRKQQRDQTPTKEGKTQSTGIHITMPDDSLMDIQYFPLEDIIKKACNDLTAVDSKLILEETKRSLFDGISLKDIYNAMTMSARTLIEKEPNYTFVTAQLLLNKLKREICQSLNLETDITNASLNVDYKSYFKKAIQTGVKLNLLDKKLLQFDLNLLAENLEEENDKLLTYLSLQTLYDRYFLHNNEHRFELPQVFFMRVAMGLALNESEPTRRAIEFYQLLSSFKFMSSTPTLFNSGTLKPQLSSCYLTTIPDDLSGIYDAFKDNALLSKYAGGLGNDWSCVRAMGAHIKGTNGKSQGSVPFMKVANDTAVAVNQGGKRKGAVCAYLETWHLDIEEFLELRKNTGDERRRTHDMNTANWIPDLFMKRVYEEAEWTLFSPDEAPELHEKYGQDFETIYLHYEQLAQSGKIKSYKTLPALQLWRKMLNLLFETGHPWITFKDPCNIRSPQQHRGVIHSSNLCTEITLNTSQEEIAVCNLGSINLVKHLKSGELDHLALEKTVQIAIRMLDNVIDLNFYSVKQARHSNLQHRPIGLGLMGFQDALYKNKIAYASAQAVEFADKTMEAISYYAIKSSSQLAEERGQYSTFEGSLWSQGVLPIDSIKNLENIRGQYLNQDRSMQLDWDTLRQRVTSCGMRNSNVLAIAPTATISNICGVSQSIEPTYQNLYVKSNLSGDFTVINPYLVQDLKALDLWDDVMINDLKYFNGSLQAIHRIPEHLKIIYATSFEIDPKWLIEAASRRQKWIDQSQSLNLYIREPSGKKLDKLYKLAWEKGLKTTYYLRSMGATNIEKSTISENSLNSVSIHSSQTKACSINEPDCEACQ